MPTSQMPLVLVPGFMLDDSLWDELLERMPATAVVHFANLLEGQTIPQIAQRIASNAPPRFVLVGFSLGGYVARSLAHQFPDRVAALILIATSLRVDSPAQLRVKQSSIEASAQRQFRGLSFGAIAKSVHPQRVNDRALIAGIREMGRRLGHATFVTQSMLDRSIMSPGNILCPTLIIAAAQDGLRRVEEAQELCEHIPGARLEMIDGSGHMLPLEQPEALARLISRWLAAEACATANPPAPSDANIHDI